MKIKLEEYSLINNKKFKEILDYYNDMREYAINQKNESLFSIINGKLGLLLKVQLEHLPADKLSYQYKYSEDDIHNAWIMGSKQQSFDEMIEFFKKSKEDFSIKEIEI
jgi:hypothetical protein